MSVRVGCAMDLEDVLKEYAAADAIAEEIISDRHQVQSLSARVCSVSRWSMYKRTVAV